MPGVLTWKQVGQSRMRGCSLCGWISALPGEDSVAPLLRAAALKQIKAAFKGHNCKDYPTEPRPPTGIEDKGDPEDASDGPAFMASPPLDRTVLGTSSGYWQVRVTSAHRTRQQNLLLTLDLRRDVDGENMEVRILRLHIPLSELASPVWQRNLSAQVRRWIENRRGSGFLRIDRLIP